MSVTLLKLQVGWTCQNKQIAASFLLADALRRRKLAEDTAHCRFIQPLSHGGLDKQTAALIPSPPTSSTWWEVSTFTFPSQQLLSVPSSMEHSIFFRLTKNKLAWLGWNWNELHQPDMDHWSLTVLHMASALLICWPRASSGCCQVERGRLLSRSGSKKGWSAVLGRMEQNNLSWNVQYLKKGNSDWSSGSARVRFSKQVNAAV